MSLAYHGGSFSSGLRNFTGAVSGRIINTGKLYYGKSADISNFLPNFSDSLGQIIKGSSDFNQDLYDMLTQEEKNQLFADKARQMAFMAPMSMLPFLSIFKDTREGLQELLGIRNPELLKKAIERYEIKLIEDEDLKRQVKIDAEIEKEISEFESRMRAEEKNKIINESLNIPAPTQSIPVVRPVNSYDVPIDITRGRGLNIFGDKELFELRRNRHRLK